MTTGIQTFWRDPAASAAGYYSVPPIMANGSRGYIMPKHDFMHGTVECMAMEPHGLFAANQAAECVEGETAVLRHLLGHLLSVRLATKRTGTAYHRRSRSP